MSRVKSTTVVGVRRPDAVALAGDGQITVGELVLKSTARKIRRLYHDTVLGGFSGASADAMTLFDKFEAQLEQNAGKLRRAAVDLAKEWRSDKFLRQLDAWLLVAGQEGMLIVSGSGDLIEPDGDVAAIGSGGPYAHAAAKALLCHSQLSAPEIARFAMETAAGLCIYTNNEISVEVLELQTIPIPDNRESSAAGVR